MAEKQKPSARWPSQWVPPVPVYQNNELGTLTYTRRISSQKEDVYDSARCACNLRKLPIQRRLENSETNANQIVLFALWLSIFRGIHTDARHQPKKFGKRKKPGRQQRWIRRMDGGRRRSRSDSPSLSAGSRDGNSAPGRQPQSCVVLCCCRLCPRHPVTVSGPSTFAEPARQHTPVSYRQPSAWQRVTTNLPGADFFACACALQSTPLHSNPLRVLFLLSCAGSNLQGYMWHTFHKMSPGRPRISPGFVDVGSYAPLGGSANCAQGPATCQQEGLLRSRCLAAHISLFVSIYMSFSPVHSCCECVFFICSKWAAPCFLLLSPLPTTNFHLPTLATLAFEWLKIKPGMPKSLSLP
uniref:HDC15018 n=1 Tax=Drosophila melanogaster TaxID=7227 RepID=Q6IJF2_DROME|nr:TPA_inf: HDC15018 [Drosophila melanogaster]